MSMAPYVGNEPYLHMCSLHMFTVLTSMYVPTYLNRYGDIDLVEKMRIDR